jgi:plasmid stabilization system protein ParE
VKVYRVVFSPNAENDLLDLAIYIADHSSYERAMNYIARIETWCHGLGMLPMRGADRKDIQPGIRVAGFERRATVAFHVGENTVTILRILYGGRNLDIALDEL